MKQILVIEDDQYVRENLLDLLEAEGYQTIGSQDGEEGLRLAWEFLPDLIVCDILMPRMDGFGVLARLRRDARTATIPVLLLTALSSREDTRRGMGLGADDYITKPFTREELLGAVKLRLEIRKNLLDQAQRKLADMQATLTRNLPYELLTPLSVVIGFSELLMDDDGRLNSAQIREMAQDIHSAGQRLVRLVQNYILLNDLDNLFSDPKKIAAVRASREIVQAAEAITEIAWSKAQQAERQNDLQIQVCECRLPVSETHLQKIIEELLDNAFNFSMRGSIVSITTELDPVQKIYRIQIQDNGRGIPIGLVRQLGDIVNFNPRIFQEQGAGMGLIIVRRLVNLYQGEMKITSFPDQGTTVQIRLSYETLCLF